MNILRKKTSRQGFVLFIALFVLFLLFISPVKSINLQTDEQIVIGTEEIIEEDIYLAGETITIDGTVKGNVVAAGEVITLNGTIEDDVYLFGEQVTINGLVQGDVVTAAKLITINDTVEGDVTTAGQSIVINGRVGDDLRMAGQVLLLNDSSQVGDDAIAAGLSLEAMADSRVGGNIAFVGGQTLLAGIIEKNLVGASEAIKIAGTVNQEINVLVSDRSTFRPPFTPQSPLEIPDIQPGLTLTDSARVQGKLSYRSPSAANISEQAQITGEIVREDLEQWEATQTPVSERSIFINQLRRFITLAIIGWLLWKFVPHWVQTLATTVQRRPFPSLGWGVVSLLVVLAVALGIFVTTSIATVIFAFTLQGLVLPIIGLGMSANLLLLVSFGIFSGFIPQIVVSYLGGRWLLQKNKPELVSKHFVSLLLGLVIFVILTAIPILGSLLSLLVILVGLGALWLWGQSQLGKTTSSGVATETVL